MNPLPWNEIKARATRFATKWQDTTDEIGQIQPFYIDFFDVFGIPSQSVFSFEHPIRLFGKRQGCIDLLWKGKLIVKHKSVGSNLVKAIDQAHIYISGMKQSERPQYILASEFQNFIFIDLAKDLKYSFELSNFSKNVKKFEFIRDEKIPTYINTKKVIIEAFRLVGKLYDKLKHQGAEQDLEKFLVLLVFCFFADCTGVFEADRIFLKLIEKRTSPDGKRLKWTTTASISSIKSTN